MAKLENGDWGLAACGVRRMSQKDPALVIVGASRGLGGYLLEAFSENEQGWIGVSRSFPKRMDEMSNWIFADVATPEGCDAIAASLGDRPIECLIYCAGDWETRDLSDTASSEIFRIVATNLSGFLTLSIRLRQQLVAGNANVIAIGSISGLDSSQTSAAAYAASKHGLRGAVQSLREWFRGSEVRVTCFSVGSLRPVAEDGGQRRKIPYSDLADLIGCIRGLTGSAVVKEIVLPAIDDRDA